MIVDATGTILLPGNFGKECLGNGTHKGIECCCDECDYMLCCVEPFDPKKCKLCDDKNCPRSEVI